MATKRRHAFLSYCHENAAEIAELYDDLIEAGEEVWVDKESILPGENWKDAIQLGIEQSYAMVLCLSKEVESRRESVIYSEIREAIERYRSCKPGSIYLIPVRLSECEIPRIKIDATSWLSDLHYIDLFPKSNRPEGLKRLIAALRKTPDHP